MSDLAGPILAGLFAAGCMAVLFVAAAILVGEDLPE